MALQMKTSSMRAKTTAGRCCGFDSRPAAHMFRFSLRSLFALTVALAAICAIVRYLHTPSLTVHSNIVNLGAVSIGDIYKVPFKLSNRGRRDIAIQWETCGCSIAHIEMPSVVRPGESVDVLLHLRIRELIHTPMSRFDRIEMPCSVRTDDFAARQIKLTVVAIRDNATQPLKNIDEQGVEGEALDEPL